MHPLDWSHMKVLLVIFEQGSISGAAKVMHIDQSTLSRRLSMLESQLGHKLFARSKTGAHPTAFARALMPMAQEMEQAMRRVRTLASPEHTLPQGTVRLAVPEVVAQFFLIPHLKDSS